jgi:hypothetical protein
VARDRIAEARIGTCAALIGTAYRRAQIELRQIIEAYALNRAFRPDGTRADPSPVVWTRAAQLWCVHEERLLRLAEFEQPRPRPRHGV